MDMRYKRLHVRVMSNLGGLFNRLDGLFELPLFCVCESGSDVAAREVGLPFQNTMGVFYDLIELPCPQHAEQKVSLHRQRQRVEGLRLTDFGQGFRRPSQCVEVTTKS